MRGKPADEWKGLFHVFLQVEHDLNVLERKLLEVKELSLVGHQNERNQGVLWDD